MPLCWDELRALPLDQWPVRLIEHSGRPGPSGNIELGLAVAEEGDADDRPPCLVGWRCLNRAPEAMQRRLNAIKWRLKHEGIRVAKYGGCFGVVRGVSG